MAVPYRGPTLKEGRSPTGQGVPNLACVRGHDATPEVFCAARKARVQAMREVQDNLEALWRGIDGREGGWMNIVEKYGEAYRRAYRAHVAHLPVRGPDVGVKEAFSTLSAML